MSIARFQLAVERRRMIDDRLARHRQKFEKYGVDFAKGFVAGYQGQTSPWYSLMKRSLSSLVGAGLAIRAAQDFLLDSGVDPTVCAREFFSSMAEESR